MAGAAPRGVDTETLRGWARQMSPLGPRTLKVVWDISNKCNLRCRMCHFAKDEVFRRPAEYMTPETFARLAEEALPHAHTLILSAGNEPMTSPWFAEILDIAARYEVPDFLFITNATRMTRKIAEAILRAGVTQVQISIDGATQATYEAIRRGADFEKLCKNIRALTAMKRRTGRAVPRLQFNIVLMRSNLEELEQFVPLAEDLGVEWIAARHLLVMQGLGVEQESLSHVPELANAHFRKFLARAEASDSVRVISFPDYFDVDLLREQARGRRLFDTAQPFGVIDLPAQGEVAHEGATGLVLEGWALDSVLLTGITIERPPGPAEAPPMVNGRGLVHVTDGVTGLERPDVGDVYPEFTSSRESGWRAVVRPDMLDARADGPVTIKVMAHSLRGTSTLLGERHLLPEARTAGV